MARSFPPDVVVLDSDTLLHARLGRGRSEPRVLQAKTWRVPADTFTSSIVTPELANEGALADVLRRVKNETGRWDKASLLLPDSWFRINLIDLPALPDRRQEAEEVVRWSLKRTLPIDPTGLRVAYEVLSKGTEGVKLLVLSATEKTLSAIERLFAAAGIEVILIEPVGLNIWNAIAVREEATTNDRLFLYVRDNDFTTAVVRGPQPLFIRSRNLSGERSLTQEIRLSASYLRDTLRTGGVEACWVAGRSVDEDLAAAVREEFSADVKPVLLRDFAETDAADVSGYDAELTACTGVFTG